MKALPTLSRRQFAEALQVAPSTVTAWMQAGLPHRNSGRQGRTVSIPLAEALPWLAKHRANASDSQRERLAKEQADRVALANAAQRGDHMLRSQVEPVLMTLAANLSASLDAIAGRLATELASVSDPAQVRQRLLAEHREVRAQLANNLRTLARGSAPA